MSECYSSCCPKSTNILCIYLLFICWKRDRSYAHLETVAVLFITSICSWIKY